MTSNWPPFSAIVEANSQQRFTNGGFTITLLLGVCVVAVFVGQAVGVSLWRRRYAAVAAG